MRPYLFILSLILLVILPINAMAQQDSVIAEIKENFKTWQPIIAMDSTEVTTFYLYSWGDRYENQQWQKTMERNDTLFLTQTSTIMQKDSLGYFMQEYSTSPSGDWLLIVDYYYDVDGDLYFAFWRLNTFLAEEPVTVQRRFYYNKDGEPARLLKSVYKLGTKEEVDVSYSEPPIRFEIDFSETEVYFLWLDSQ